MARIRSVHPGQWTDDQFVSCTPLARLLALGLRNESDDNGIFEWNPVKLKMRILPADNCDIEALLVELVASQQIIQYDVGGKKYGLIRNFKKYQKPKYPTYSYPLPEHLPEAFELTEADSGSASGNDEQRERRGEERSGEGKARKRATALPASFVVDEELRQWGRELGFNDIKLQQETAKFRDYHCSKGSTFKDWRAAWRTWMRKAAEWNKPDSKPSPTRGAL